MAHHVKLVISCRVVSTAVTTREPDARRLVFSCNLERNHHLVIGQ